MSRESRMVSRQLKQHLNRTYFAFLYCMYIVFYHFFLILDPNYRQKMLNDIKKVRNESNCLKADKSNNLVELQLMDGSHQVHLLKISAAKRDRALKDLAYATQLLDEHLSALGSSSNVSQETLLNTRNDECERDSAALKKRVSDGKKGAFQLTLIDSASMESFTFFVDQKAYHLAQTDIVFATQLLDKHKETIDQQKLNSLSTNIDTKETENNNDELQNLIETYEKDDIEDDETSSKQTGRYAWNNAETL
ncbi:uncharacterized protein LOC103315376 [Nasonia vitripennis]|uniref:Uncharacterized protein n=1 Tax=Nasonia vitripennis TaxID=7425 RepID=A0A7M7Q4S3_NASVI|nr:uncharacterized protein LOC103315376 [Nasonia vitripennis]